MTDEDDDIPWEEKPEQIKEIERQRAKQYLENAAARAGIAQKRVHPSERFNEEELIKQFDRSAEGLPEKQEYLERAAPRMQEELAKEDSDTAKILIYDDEPISLITKEMITDEASARLYRTFLTVGSDEDRKFIDTEFSLANLSEGDLIKRMLVPPKPELGAGDYIAQSRQSARKFDMTIDEVIEQHPDFNGTSPGAIDVADRSELIEQRYPNYGQIPDKKFTVEYVYRDRHDEFREHMVIFEPETQLFALLSGFHPIIYAGSDADIPAHYRVESIGHRIQLDEVHHIDVLNEVDHPAFEDDEHQTLEALEEYLEADLNRAFATGVKNTLADDTSADDLYGDFETLGYRWVPLRVAEFLNKGEIFYNTLENDDRVDARLTLFADFVNGDTIVPGIHRHID